MIKVIQIIICFKIALNSQYFDFINNLKNAVFVFLGVRYGITQTHPPRNLSMKREINYYFQI